MEIFYIENFKVPDRREVKEQHVCKSGMCNCVEATQLNGMQPFELRTICFIKTTPTDFIQSLGLDELYTTDVKLVSDIAPIYYDTTTKAFYKYLTSIKQDEFAQTAINMTLEHGHIMTKIDWSPNFLSPKILIGKLIQRFIKDMIKHDFEDLYK